MKILGLLIFAHMVTSQSSQKTQTVSQKEKKDFLEQNLRHVQQLLQEEVHSNLKSENLENKSKMSDDFKNSIRKSKSLAFFPFFPPAVIPFRPPPGIYNPNNKEIIENPYPEEWLSRTEPFKKNPPLLDSPTYYIRLPPKPYAFVPGVGYVSRPSLLSHPGLLEDNKPEHQGNHLENDILYDPFYRLPINFLSNGKPTSIYQLPNGHGVPKPESALVNLNKGPYVFNGKPSEIYLVAQIYDALYGDELSHFYP